MAKQRSGYVFQDNLGKWYARTTITDSTGKRRNVKRRAKDRSDAKRILKTIVRQLEDQGEKSIEAASLTVNHLCDYYERVYLHPAKYVQEKKVSGLRDLGRPQLALRLFRESLGAKKLMGLTYGDIYEYRALRLKVPTIYKQPRTIAAMNREMGVLRRLLNVAVQQGWISKSPFTAGDSLISLASENKRERVLSFTEERRLLAAIEAEPRRAHLKPILLIALDCALRRNEILTLVWADVDFNRRTLTVRAYNAKTARSRTVAMTKRVYDDVLMLWQESGGNAGTKVFNVKTVRTAFVKTCKVAGVLDFHLHDARHTAITRMVRAGMPPVEVMRVSGHTTLGCFYRYANLDDDTVFRAAAALDCFIASQNRDSQGDLSTEAIN